MKSWVRSLPILPPGRVHSGFCVPADLWKLSAHLGSQERLPGPWAHPFLSQSTLGGALQPQAQKTEWRGPAERRVSVDAETKLLLSPLRPEQNPKPGTSCQIDAQGNFRPHHGSKARRMSTTEAQGPTSTATPTPGRTPAVRTAGTQGRARTRGARDAHTQKRPRGRLQAAGPRRESPPETPTHQAHGPRQRHEANQHQKPAEAPSRGAPRQPGAAPSPPGLFSRPARGGAGMVARRLGRGACGACEACGPWRGRRRGG